MQSVATFLMFDGKAEDAMNLYTSVVPGGEITSIRKYEAGQGGTEGTVMYASFKLGDQLFSCIDSPGKHQFGFTPAMSIYITCDTGTEVDNLYTKLSEGGQVMMPLGAYPFSKKYAWFSDKFGVSWQVGLAM